MGNHMRRLFAFVLLLSFSAAAQTLSPDLRQKIDKVAQDTLAKTGVPSASIAIVKDGQIAYLQAYGLARLEPRTPAKPEMRYSISGLAGVRGSSRASP